MHIFPCKKPVLPCKGLQCKIAKVGPGFDDRPEHPSVQINSSSPCLKLSILPVVDSLFFENFEVSILGQ